MTARFIILLLLACGTLSANSFWVAPASMGGKDC